MNIKGTWHVGYKSLRWVGVTEESAKDKSQMEADNHKTGLNSPEVKQKD